MANPLLDVTGKPIDLSGPDEPAPQAVGAPTTDPRATKYDTEVTNPVMSAVNQFSWGFNSMLFALPDAAVAALGHGLHVQKDKIPSLVQMFNRGESAPHNTVERYARALGEGVAGTLPVTGLSLAAARAMPAAAATLTAAPEASLMKEIAKNAIDIYKTSPAKAAATDVVFGAAYEGFRQAVEENVDDSNPKKQLLKEVLPAAAFVGLPMAVQLSPTAWAMRKAGTLFEKGSNAVLGKEASLQEGLSTVGKEVLDQEVKDNWLYGIPPFKIIPSTIIGRAEKQLGKVFKGIESSPVAQQSLKDLEEIMADPKVQALNFQFGASERYMDPAMLQRQRESMEKMGPQELEVFRNVYNENHQKINKLLQSFAPEARQSVEEAFTAAQARRQQFFDDLLRQKTDLTDTERAMLSQRLGPQDPDQINNELRGIIMSGMEMDYSMRDKILRKMGLRQAYSPEGLLEGTREEGKSLYPSRDMEAAATALIKKYHPERPSMRIEVPTPIAYLKNFVKKQQVAREKMTQQMMGQLTNQAITDQLGPYAAQMPEDFQKALRESILQLVEGTKTKVSKRKVSLADIAAAPDEHGNITVATGIPGRKVHINPEQIRKDAEQIATANTGIDINVPEALDYIKHAQAFRNDSINKFNAAMARGESRATAQRLLDTGNQVFKDIENLVLTHTPKVKQEYEGMKMLLDDYKAGYEQKLPLLLTKKTAGDKSYYLPNEDLMHNAFKTAENLRQLQITIGNNVQGKELLEKGAIDWMARKNIYNKDGLIDPRKMRAELDKNKNILKELPASIQMKYQDELKMADDLAVRMGELDSRRVAAKDNDLDNLLLRAAKQDADPKLALDKALRDPAMMRGLVGELGKDPENLAALRRSVYDMAQPLIEQGQSLETFLRQHEKSLRVLFGKQGHYEDLMKLANLQKRTEAFSDIVGQVPVFDTTDEMLQRAAGVSIPYVTTTIRNVGMRHISPETAGFALFTRLLNAKESKIYNRLFTKAMEDPDFAKKITSIKSEETAKPVIKELEKIGLKPSFWTTMAAGPNTVRAAKAEAARLAKPEEGNLDVSRETMAPEEAPTRRPPQGPSASQMLRQLPTAPASRGMGQASPAQPRLPTFTPTPPAQMPPGQMYPALFPHDPISAMMAARPQAPAQ